jgi:hypothetical protein
VSHLVSSSRRNARASLKSRHKEAPGRAEILCFSVMPSRYSMAMKASPVRIVNFIDCADVGMVQRRRGLGLPLKTRQSLGIFGYVVRQELEGHDPAKFQVFGLIDHSHPAATKLFYDAIVRDGATQHCLES